MRISRILAVTYRSFKTAYRDPNNISNILYFPIIDVLMIGFVGAWAQGGTGHGGIMTSVLAGVVAWSTIFRASMDVAVGFLLEMWDSHLINLCATPLNIGEIALGHMINSSLQCVVIFCYSSLLILFFYGINMFAPGLALLPYIALFMVCGWFIGLLSSVVVLYCGRNTGTFAWSTPWLFATISGAYSPTYLFPVWLQKIAGFLPTTYAFQGMRDLVTNNTWSVRNLTIGFGLAFIYFALAFVLVSYIFERSKNKGLARLE